MPWVSKHAESPRGLKGRENLGSIESNDTAVQRRRERGAQRATRPSVCNGGLGSGLGPRTCPAPLLRNVSHIVDRCQIPVRRPTKRTRLRRFIAGPEQADLPRQVRGVEVEVRQFVVLDDLTIAARQCDHSVGGVAAPARASLLEGVLLKEKHRFVCPTLCR